MISILQYSGGNPVTRWSKRRGPRRDRKLAIKPSGTVFAELPETVNIHRTTEDDDTEGGRAEFVTKIAERFKGNGRI